MKTLKKTFILILAILIIKSYGYKTIYCSNVYINKKTKIEKSISSVNAFNEVSQKCSTLQVMKKIID